jgi:hypothetical protein
MSRSIGEADWKLFRALHANASSRFYARAIAEIRSILAGQSASDAERFSILARLIDQQSREASRLFDDVRRSTAVFQLMLLRASGLVTDDEYSRFGFEVRGAIEHMQASSAQEMFMG